MVPHIILIYRFSVNQVSVNTKGAIHYRDEKLPFAFLGISSDKWNSIFRNLARYIPKFSKVLAFHPEFKVE